MITWNNGSLKDATTQYLFEMINTEHLDKLYVKIIRTCIPHLSTEPICD